MQKTVIYKQLFVLAFPIMLQQLVTMSLNLVENLMVGGLGEASVAAVSFANKVFFVYILMLFGLLGGFAIFVSQFYGKKDMVMVRKLFALAGLCSLLIGILFAGLVWFFAYDILRIFSIDEEVIKLGGHFLRTTTITYPLIAISLTMTVILRAIGKTMIPLLVSATVAFLNTFLNYVLIYGHFGFPRLETFGAALSVTIIWAVEAIAFIIIFYFTDTGLRGKLREYFGLSRAFIKEVAKVATPVFFTEFCWVGGTTLLSVAYSKFGTQTVAAMQVSELVMNIGVIIFMGLANGANILIAQTIGSGKSSRAFLMAREILKASLFMAAFSVVAGLLLLESLLGVYNFSEETKDIAKTLLIITAGSMFFKLLNWVNIIGFLRAGGDTKYSFVIDTVFLFSYAVPIAFLGALVWHINIYLLVILVNLEEVFKLIFAMYRFFSKKWINDLTKTKEKAESQIAKNV